MQLSPAFRPHRQLFSVPALLALLPLFAGCGSTGSETAESSPYVPLPDPEPDSIGFFLTEFDASLRAWTNLKLAGRGERDERMRRTLEREMTQRARKRSEDLLQEFETGPPSNRAVAAVALGFTKDPAMMSPLYAALNALNRPDRKIITAEDPVEYYLPGINQVEVRHSIGLDFARIIRSMLRQAPNIILVGEMRDEETASMGIQASLTGHLVFSTLHTNDAPSAVSRMVDIGVPGYMVASSVIAVLAQRLVRTICPRCKIITLD